MSKFKLIDSIAAYTCGDRVCLCSSTESTEVSKAAERKGWTQKMLQSQCFSIKINKHLGLDVKINRSWYSIENLSPNTVYRILSQNICTNSELSEKFEVAMNNQGLVFLVSENMEEYETFSNEMIRVLNCSAKKKAKKFVIGHRYDSQEETIYCLGEFDCHKGQGGNTEWLSDGLQQKVYLVSTTIKGCNTVSEVLNTKILGKEIKIMYDKGKGSYVDSGEKLKVDLKNGKLEDKQINNLLSNANSVKDKLDLLSLEGVHVKEDAVESIVEELLTLCKKNIMIYKNTEFTLPDIYEITDKKSIDDNVTALEYLVYRDIKDINLSAGAYYTTLFLVHGIDIKNEFKTILNTFDPKEVTFKSFESYLENCSDYLKFRDLGSISSNIMINQRKNTYFRYKNTNPTITIDSVVGYKELTDLIVEIANNAIEKDGGDISSFDIINIGSDKSPLEYISLRIDINDILKYKKGISNVSENLKHEIMTSKFQCIQLEVDKGDKIQ